LVYWTAHDGTAFGGIISRRVAGRTRKEIKEAAEKELKDFYPDDPNGAKPIAYLWARTVKCEAPNCGAEIPLMRSFWLSKKEGRKRALRYQVKGAKGKGESPEAEFEIFEPKNDREVPVGTVTRAKATCLCCNTVLPPERVRAQLVEEKGGADVIFDGQGNRIGGARLLAVVALQIGEQGRQYRLSTANDYKAVWKTQKKLKEVTAERTLNGLNPIPNELVDKWHHDINRLPMYGMMTWGDAFTARQKLALFTTSGYLSSRLNGEGGLLGLVLGRVVDFWVALARWKADAECPVQALARQALPMVWDFAEANPWSQSTGSIASQVARMSAAIESVCISYITSSQVQMSDACDSPLPNESASVWFTDPPYYDAISYAHCSDFFYVWMKRMLPNGLLPRDPLDLNNMLTPKMREIIVDSTTTKGHGIRTPRFYETSMGQAFSEGRRVLDQNGVGCIVFAHKTTEGWEALLSGMIKGGWTITGSWPIATEMSSRLRAMDSAALATSIHLVCRPRPEDAPVGDWGDVLRELPRRVGDWMERLQKEHIRGADLVFACIGPALEIFSRYSRVETADGKEVTLAQYLEKVWEVVGRTALENVLGSAEAVARNGMAGALEEDARLTALFLWTLQSSNGESGNVRKGEKEEIEGDDDNEDEEDGSSKTKPKGFSLIFDVARRFAQPLGIHLPEWEGRIIETKKGIVRLLSVSERAEQLFGKEGTRSVAERIERSPDVQLQGMLFPEYEETFAPRVRGRRKTTTERISINVSEETLSSRREATTLDRVHAAMLLQSSGQPNALRALLRTEHERGTDFIRLANALSALYPKTSEEKRLLDAMLLAYPK